jgi:hypothetical protein
VQAGSQLDKHYRSTRHQNFLDAYAEHEDSIRALLAELVQKQVDIDVSKTAEPFLSHTYLVLQALVNQVKAGVFERNKQREEQYVQAMVRVTGACDGASRPKSCYMFNHEMPRICSF